MRGMALLATFIVVFVTVQVAVLRSLSSSSSSSAGVNTPIATPSTPATMTTTSVPRSPDPEEAAWETDPQRPVNITRAVQRGLARFLSITGGRTVFSARDCIETSLTCGRACGFHREARHIACYCLRLQGSSIRYLRKPDRVPPQDDPFVNDWRNEMFRNLMMSMNKIMVAVYEAGLYFDQPVYMVVNVFDYARLYTELDHSYPSFYQPPNRSRAEEEAPRRQRHPRITYRHDSDTMPYEFFHTQAMQGGFPNPDKFRPDFQCGSPEGHFPLLSWSVNPRLNFDIVIPHSHSGDCKPWVLNQSIVEVPWEDKLNMLTYKGTAPGSCNASDPSNHRFRFCAVGNGPLVREYTRVHNVTLDIFGPKTTPAEQAQSKYVFLLDGAVAAFRTTWLLTTGSVIFMASAMDTFRTQFMIPHVHYIPVKNDFSNLLDKLDMVVHDEDYARWVANNAVQLGRQISLDPEGLNDGGFTFDKAYWKVFLKEYQKTFTFSETVADLANFTEERYCDTYQRPRTKCFANNSYACEDLLQDGFPDYPKMKYIPSVLWRKNASKTSTSWSGK